jgi:hypothetical protein
VASLCVHCGKWADSTEDLTIHIGHFCRSAPSGAVAQAREGIEVPRGEVRARVPSVDPAQGATWGTNRGRV